MKDFLLEHADKDPVSFHMPGHKGADIFRKYGYGEFLDRFVDCDVTEITGADNLFQPEGIIKDVMDRYAALYDVQNSYLLINGSSTGLIASVMASVRPGGVIEKRLQGYRRALEEFHIGFDPSLVFTQEISPEEGKKLGRLLAAKPEITGIFATADILAAGIIAGLGECGVRVPRDRSVVGFDDNYLARLTVPGLTTIHQDADRKGFLATDMILRRLRREPIEEKKIVLPVRLVERGSVRALET